MFLLKGLTMKEINVIFEDKQFKKLSKIKKRDGLTWRKFILKLIK